MSAQWPIFFLGGDKFLNIFSKGCLKEAAERIENVGFFSFGKMPSFLQQNAASKVR